MEQFNFGPAGSQISDLTGATSQANGARGIVPAPLIADKDKFLKGDGTWESVPNPSEMTGAGASTSGTSGLVPAPAAGDNEKFLRGDGTWVVGGKPMVILSYGSSTWNDFINAYQSNVIVYCRASSNTNPGTGSQNRMAFMAYVNDSTNPTEVEFQYYRSVATHTNTQQGDQVYVYKLNSAGTWSVITREAYTKVVAGENLTSSYSSGTLTISGNYGAFTGAGASASGTTGLVPAPASGNHVYYLKGDGTWDNPPGSKLIEYTLDTVTNTSGSYTHTTTISSASANMKAIMIELGNSDAFLDIITITPADGSITLSCNSVAGTSTVKVSLLYVAGADAITSSEFDVLNARIGSLSSLTTTEKSSTVGAINELAAHIGNLQFSGSSDETISFNGLSWSTSGGWKYATKSLSDVFGNDKDVKFIQQLGWSGNYVVALLNSNGTNVLLQALASESINNNGHITVRGFYV